MREQIEELGETRVEQSLGSAEAMTTSRMIEGLEKQLVSEQERRREATERREDMIGDSDRELDAIDVRIRALEAALQATLAGPQPLAQPIRPSERF